MSENESTNGALVMAGRGPVDAAFDELGNPVCKGCGMNPLGYAALRNSRSPRTCFCPPRDPRVKDEPEMLADARLRITAALDYLAPHAERHAPRRAAARPAARTGLSPCRL